MRSFGEEVSATTEDICLTGGFRSGRNPTLHPLLLACWRVCLPGSRGQGYLRPHRVHGTGRWECGSVLVVSRGDERNFCRICFPEKLPQVLMKEAQREEEHRTTRENNKKLKNRRVTLLPC